MLAQRDFLGETVYYTLHVRCGVLRILHFRVKPSLTFLVFVFVVGTLCCT